MSTPIRIILAVACALYAGCSLALIGRIYANDGGALAVTLRHQYSGWHGLFQLYRDTAAYAPNASLAGLPTGEALRARALDLAWCNFTAAPGAAPPDFCECVSSAHDAYLRDTGPEAAAVPQAAREAAVRRLLPCLGARPVWRVWRVWGVNVATMAVYVLAVAASFCWVALDLGEVDLGGWWVPEVTAHCGCLSVSSVPDGASRSLYPMWLYLVAVIAAVVCHAPLDNLFWVVSLALLVMLIEKVLLPGMEPLGAPAGGSGRLGRLPSCFWWCEYLTAPFYALLVPLLHCGRDFYLLTLTFVLGGAIGGLGLRSFWCSQAYAAAHAGDRMRLLAWLGMLAAGAALLALAGAYHDASSPLATARAAVPCLCLTLAIGLLEGRWAPAPDTRLALQAALALARNLALLGCTLSDMQ